VNLFSTVKNKLSALRDRFTRKQHTPAAKPAPERIICTTPVDPYDPRPSLPALALAVLTKQVGKRRAFEIAKANYGEDGVAGLASEIAAARRQWLPRLGELRYATDGTVYEVAKDGSLRKRGKLAAMEAKS
jgi:hypothetical protein